MGNAITRFFRGILAAFGPRAEAAPPPGGKQSDADIVSEHALSYGAAPDPIAPESHVEAARMRNFGTGPR
jgi:hypothetical protein